MIYLITGASRGIGFELVKQLASDSHNTIIATARNQQRLDALAAACSELPGKVVTQSADITTAAGRDQLRELLSQTASQLHVLVNNAGQLLNKPFAQLSEQEVTGMFTANLYAPLHLSQTLLPLLEASNGAHIINISSMGGVQGSAKFPGLSAYSASKGALAILTECMAEELKDKNISVNCLALGAVQTEMLAEAFPGYEAPLTAKQMADYIAGFARTGAAYYNGKVLPVSVSTP